jgi:hypothetical protein
MTARKPIQDLIAELQSWLPNYDHGPADYPTLLWRILASAPGGDRAEDMGYEPFQLGWQEIDQLGRVLVAIQDQRDVEDLIQGLIGEEEEEVEERRRRRPPPMRQGRPTTAPRRPARTRPIKLDWGVLPDERDNPPAGAKWRPPPPRRRRGR